MTKMKITILKNVERINLMLVFWFFIFLFFLLDEVHCIYKQWKIPKVACSINTYGIINSGITLKDKEEYIKHVHKHVHICEQKNKKRKLFFLPLIIEDKRTDEEEEVGERGKWKELKEQNDNSKDIKISNKSVETKDNQTVFEFIESNLQYVYEKMENFCEYLEKSDYVIIPINYYDILNKHLLDIHSFKNFINAINTLFYLEQKKKKYEIIILVYNYKEEQNVDKTILKEKAQIANIIRTFLKNHWKNIYDEYFIFQFLFQEDNVLDFGKIEKSLIGSLHNKARKEEKKEKENETEEIKIKTLLNKTFLANYKPDILKNLNEENYFLYHFFASYKIGLLKEYLKLAKNMNINDADKDIKNINVQNLSRDIEKVLNQFLYLKLSDKLIDKKNAEYIKKKQYLYLLNIILTDILERYESNLEMINKMLYALFKENIKKIKVSHNLIMDFQKEIYNIDKLFDIYNSKVSFSGFLKKKDKNMEQKASYIYYYNKMKLLQLLHETSNEILNYYISKGLYVKNFSFNSFKFLNKYSLINYIIYYIGTLLKNKLSITFNYLSPNAFGLSSYKDDISLSPKKDLMITTSEIDQIKKINIPQSEYSKILLLLDKNKM